MAGRLGPPRPLAEAADVGPHGGAAGDVLDVAAEVLGAVRRAKTAHKRSMRARVARLVVSGPADVRRAVEAARGDLLDAGGVVELALTEGDVLAVTVTLAEEA